MRYTQHLARLERQLARQRQREQDAPQRISTIEVWNCDGANEEIIEVISLDAKTPRQRGD